MVAIWKYKQGECGVQATDRVLEAGFHNETQLERLQPKPAQPNLIPDLLATRLTP
jgi:hypothetical protein